MKAKFCRNQRLVWSPVLLSALLDGCVLPKGQVAPEADSGMPTMSSGVAVQDDAGAGVDAAIAPDASVGPTVDAGAQAGSAGASEPPDAAVVLHEDSDAGTTDACPHSDRRELTGRETARVIATLAQPDTTPLRAASAVMRSPTRRWLWLMSNTDSTLPAQVDDPANQPRGLFSRADATLWSSLAPRTEPWPIEEATDAPLLPLRADETSDTSLLPVSVLVDPLDADNLLVFVLERAGDRAERVWLADLPLGARTAVRRPTPLFTTEPFFAHAARLDGERLTVYACPESDPAHGCLAAHVPKTAYADASAYKVSARDAAGATKWVSDLSAGTPVIDNVADGLTVRVNNYLNNVATAVYGQPGSNDAFIRTTRDPAGPWTASPVRVTLPPAPVLFNSQIRETPGLGDTCERQITITYFRPTAEKDGKATAGETVLAAIDLAL